MPLDSKRIVGPDTTVPYHLFQKRSGKSLKQSIEEAFNGDLRPDGRKLNEHRKIFVKTGVVSQAKGSAYIENGKTKVVVSVFDPREIPNKTEYSLKGELYCQFKYAPFSCAKRRQHQQDAEEKQNTAVLKQALESAVCRHEFPNFQIDVYALVLENDGAAVSSAITCAGLALVHAKVPMYDLVCGATLGFQNGKIILDPTVHEEFLCESSLQVSDDDELYYDHGVMVVSMLKTHEQVSEIHQSGQLSLECLSEGIDVLTKACKDIVVLVEKCLVRHVLRSVKSNVED